MNKKRCALVAAVVAAVCAVVFLCWNGPSDGTGKSVSAEVPSALAPSASSAVAAVSPASVQPSSNQTATVRGTKPYVLTCARGFNKSMRLAAESLGVRTVSVLSRKSLLVEADAAALSRVAADGRFTVETEFLPSEKLSPALAAKIAGGAGAVDVTVTTLTPADHRLVQDRVVARGGEILTGCFNEGTTFRARMPAALVSELASCGDVRWMEDFVRPQVMNDIAVNPPAMNVRPLWLSEENPEGLSGLGQIVSTSDSGIDTGKAETMHKDLVEQILGIKVVDGCVDYDAIGHGTHTAGSIVGDGTMSQDNLADYPNGPIRGTAWGAKLYAWFCGKKGSNGIYTPNTIAELFRGNEDGTAWNAYIHSASWGSAKGGEYDSECADIDRFVWEHPDFLPVFSAGNEGPDARTIGSPAAAKNVLAVGATQNLRKEGAGRLDNGDPTETAEYSSRGPCKDGRIKPDIATPGTGVLSTRAHDVDYDKQGYGNYDEFYAYDTGTSMACPLMAGAVALVREWLVRQEEFADTDETRPTAALMKAIVTGGAKDAARPNDNQGWGRFDLTETLTPSNRAVKLIDRIPFADGEELTWVVETTDPASLDVQLAWIDFPGAASGSPAEAKLVNDLDLTVRAADSEDIFYGNGGASADSLNTLESVRIAAAPANRYLVTVSCPHIFADYEEGGAAALYIRGAFDPETVVPYWTARIVKSPEVTNTYSRLDKALNDAVSGDVIEILDSIVLRESVVLTNNYDLTITATNANPRLSPINRRKGADILVRNGSLSFTNVVFRTEKSTPVHVSDAGIVRVSGTAVFDDIVSRTPGILTALPGGIELAGRLENGITVDCSGKNNPGDQFGVYSCADAVAAESAPRLVSAYDLTHSGVAEGSGGVGILKWAKDAPVDREVAIGYVEGDEPVYYRSLDRIFEDHPNGTNVVLMKSGLHLEKPRTLSGKQSIAAEDGAGEIVIYPANGAGFAIGAGCDLTVSGLAFEDYTGNGLFVVNGTDAKLTVIDSAFRNIEGTNKWSGAIAVQKGMLFVRDSAFGDCRATGDHLELFADGKYKTVPGSKSYGGAIYLGSGGALDLDGGTIVDCFAQTCGGGIYVGANAAVSVRGALTVKGNTAGNYKGKGDDDIHLVNATTSTLTLSGKLDGTDSVGVRYENSSSVKGNDVGKQFAAVADGADYASSLKAFFNDTNPDGTKAVADAAGTNLLWAVRTPGDRNVDPGDVDATIRVTKGGVTQYYIEPEYAFGWIDADATVELLKDAAFGDDLIVSNGVRVTLTSTNSEPYVLSRSGELMIRVLSGASLTVTNLVLDGNGSAATIGLVKVDGSSLELQSGVIVSNVIGKADRASGAISVQKGGTFTMRSGAEIIGCRNEYVNRGSKAGYGAGLLVEDHSTANLLGGQITGCTANRGGGVFIGTESTVNIAGNMTVSGNMNLDRLAKTNNLCVADHSSLVLTNNFSGSIGYNEGRSGDTNVFGRIAAGFSGDKQVAAHRFTHDFTGDVGMAVTDGSETLLVWGSALDADGKYDGKYALVEGDPYEIAVPSASNFIYDGTAKTSIEDGIGYRVVTGNVATDVGNYIAVVTTRAGFAWKDDGTTGQKNVPWEIRTATYVLDGVTFEDRTYVYDGKAKTLEISGTLPQGLSVTYTNNIRWEPGTNEVTACIRGSIPNYKPDPFEMTLHAKLIITDPEGLFEGDIPQQELTPVEPPEAIVGLVYNGLEQTGVAVAAEGYLLTENTAVNAGSYTATARLKRGYKWSDDTTAPKMIGWMIAKATHDMSGVSFDDATFTYDGTPKSIFVTGDLPEGVMTNYTGNGQTEVGSYGVTVSFTVDEVNYNPIDSWTRTLTITPKEEPQEYTVQTNTPTPIAFSEITRISDTEWRIVVTDLVKQAEYAVSYTPDLKTAFTTDTWFRAASGGAWTNTVQKTESAYFWRAHGRTTYVTNWIEQSK